MTVAFAPRAALCLTRTRDTCDRPAQWLVWMGMSGWVCELDLNNFPLVLSSGLGLLTHPRRTHLHHRCAPCLLCPCVPGEPTHAALPCAVPCTTAWRAGHVPRTMEALRGPWACVFWHPRCRTLWFGRDVLGERRGLNADCPIWSDRDCTIHVGGRRLAVAWIWLVIVLCERPLHLARVRLVRYSAI